MLRTLQFACFFNKSGCYVDIADTLFVVLSELSRFLNIHPRNHRIWKQWKQITMLLSVSYRVRPQLKNSAQHSIPWDSGGKLTETSLNRWTGSYSMSLVMKKSFATARRVISGMENMSMNCFTFGPCDGKYILILDVDLQLMFVNLYN